MSLHRMHAGGAMVRYGVIQALAFAALSGAGLALVMPCVTAILSDLYAEEQRGVAFGWILCAAGAGAAAPAGAVRRCLRARMAVSARLQTPSWGS